MRITEIKCQCQNLLRAIENLGIAVVYGIRYYGRGNITDENYVQFIKHDTISSEYLNQSRNFVQHVRWVMSVYADWSYLVKFP